MTLRAHRRWASRGEAFTLVELLLVLVIVAVLAAAVVPRGAGYQARLQLRETGYALVSTIRYAEALAASAGRPVTVRLEPTRYRVLVGRAQFGETLKPASGPAGAWHQLPRGAWLDVEGLRSWSGTETERDVVFLPDGRRTMGAVTIRSARGTLQVLLGAAYGDVRLTEGVGDRPWPG